mgnify:FL=1
MLVPAILYKDQIEKEFQKLYYTEDMFYYTGCLTQWYPNIKDIPGDGEFDYVIVNNADKLIGYLSYRVDYYSSKVYNFGLVSFDRGNPIIGNDLYKKLEELVFHFHRIEWRMIGGNRVEKHYDKFCKLHNGQKHILKDSIRDKNGNYHDDIIYEIVKDGELNERDSFQGKAD